MTGNDRYFIAELEERLRWYRDEASEEEFDAEEVDAICTLLQKLSPIKEPHMSREEAFQNIMRRAKEEEEGGGESEEDEEEAADLGLVGVNKKSGADDRAGETSEEVKKGVRGKRRFLPGKRGHRSAVLFIGVFGAALLSLNMVTYAREDKSLFTMILERVGLLEIVKDETVESSIVTGIENVETFYESWTELDRGVKSKIIVPKYIPDGYTLYGIDYYNHNNRERVKADYYNKENGHLLIEITLWEKNPDEYRESAMDENVYILLSEYSDKGTLYYQYDDEYICMVSMKNGFYRISGNIALEEMIKVREGLGDIK